MKQIKFGILGAGVLGVIAIFLPYISEGPISLKFWDFRKAPDEGAQPYIALVGFLAAAAMGALATMGKRLLRWQAIVALVGFGITFVTGGVRNGLLGEKGMSTAIGGKLLFIAALVGIIASIAAIAKPEKS